MPVDEKSLIIQEKNKGILGEKSCPPPSLLRKISMDARC
jgi:hypothetical protein